MREAKFVWITGLSGSGKTTIAKEVYQLLKKKEPNTVHLDGDSLREILSETSTHDIEGRRRTAKIYASLSSILIKQGINVVMSTISLFHDIHKFNRENNQNYFEIFIETDKETLKNRNQKGLYKESAKNVMGIHQTPEFPKNPHIILNNNNEADIKENVTKIMRLLENK